MALQLTQETLDRKDDLSVSHKFCCSSSHSPLVVCRLLASGLHPRNSSGNHFCYFHLFQDCGRESRHVPVVSVGMLLFPLTIAADCVTFISLTKEGRVCSGQKEACVSLGAVPRDPLHVGGSGGAQGLSIPSTGDVQYLLRTLCLGYFTEIVHLC